MPAPAPDTRILDVLAQVPDPRARRGVRHRFPAILGLALAATCAGARSFTAIAEWADDAPTTALARLGVHGRAPSESTIRRTRPGRRRRPRSRAGRVDVAAYQRGRRTPGDRCRWQNSPRRPRCRRASDTPAGSSRSPDRGRGWATSRSRRSPTRFPH
ncbi:transposase family protein [Rhodococcus zopfii]|uniref:transposase family protein n=1 Tax=Rhodococcus zopfii TaxID=43772 RepID=UPI003528EB01